MSADPIAAPERDPFEARFALQASGLLRQFNEAGVIAAADVHVARELGRLGGEAEDTVLLAAALAVRGPRLGHVHVDLAQIRDTAAVDAEEPVDLAALDWPEPEAWIARVGSSPLVRRGDAGEPAQPAPARPLRLVGSWLYLDRYWAEEVGVARALRELGSGPAPATDPELLRDGLNRLFGSAAPARQTLAAATAVTRPWSVVAGGPGTGKTTTVARIVALLYEQAAAAGAPFPLVALAAPTGKAAARLQEAVHAQAATIDVPDAVREELRTLRASTIHRLLGWRPGSNSRFRHDRNQRLAHDVVIVDETSMVSLSLMARLIEALRSSARLILVGDPGQLASIEAGAVLGDIVGDEADGQGRRSWCSTTCTASARASPGWPRPSAPATATLSSRCCAPAPRMSPGSRSTSPSRTRSPRSRSPPWPRRTPPSRPREPVTARAALDALGSFRILCAHRRGPYGVATWTARMEGWLAAELADLDPEDRWYVGRPLLVNENDYELRLNNGDTGVVVGARQWPGGGRLRPRRGDDHPRAEPAERGRHRLRHDRPQEPGIPVPGRRRAPARAGLPHPHPRAALHGGHARAGTADRGRDRGERARRGGAAGGPRVGAGTPPVGRPGGLSPRAAPRQGVALLGRMREYP